MKLLQTPLNGAYVIEPERIPDERGFFARSWCHEEFAKHGLDAQLAQCNLSFNHRKGTLRGLHFQRPPYTETKLVRCTMGVVYDVIVDLRRDSPTFLQSFGIELSAENRLMLYVPKSFAHGYLTRMDLTEVYYQVSDPYVPQSAAGYRWNDPAFQIQWPELPQVINERDNSYPDFDLSDDQLTQSSIDP